MNPYQSCLDRRKSRQFDHPPSLLGRGIFDVVSPSAAYIHRTEDHPYVSSNMMNTIYDLFNYMESGHAKNHRMLYHTTREETKVLERHKIDETDGALLKPYIRHKNQLN